MSRGNLRVILVVAVFQLMVSTTNAVAWSRFCQPNPLPPGGYIQPQTVIGQPNFRPAFMVQDGPGGTYYNRFLTVISYFGANRAGHDPRGVFGFLCNFGINGVRIFPDFWSGPGGGQCLPSAFLPLGQAVIDLNGQLQEPNVARLMNVLDWAKQYGLVVDLSFAHEVVQNRTFASHKQGIRRLAQRLAAYPGRFDHVFFDVQNEFNSVGCPVRQPWNSEIPSTIADARGANGYRAVTASTAAAPSGSLATDLFSVVDGGALLFAVHEERDGAWWSSGRWDYIMNNIGTLWTLRPWTSGQKPLIYAQEPCNVLACPGTTSQNLFDSLRHAFRKGLAGWVFHTEALFYPGPGQSLGSGWTQAELEFLGWYPSPYTLRAAIQGQCWGDTGTWIQPCVP